MARKIKEKYHGYSDTNNIFYVVYDSERSIAVSLVTGLYLLRRFFLPDEPQIFFYLETGIQHNVGFLHRTIQAIGLCVHSYSLHSFVDRWINSTSIEEATVLRQAPP